MDKYFFFVNDQRQLFISNMSLEGIKDLLLARAIIDSGTKTESVFKILKPYIEADNGEAIYLSAYARKKGERASQMEKRHAEAIKKAALLHYPTALYVYGAYLDMGDHFQQNKREASALFKRAAELGHAQSEWIYGVELLYGLGSWKKNQKEGLKWIRSSAEKGYCLAVEFMEECYRTGKFVKRNKKKAEFLKKQLEKGLTIYYE